MTTTQGGVLEEIIQFTPTEILEQLATLFEEGTIWELQGVYGFYRRLGSAALGAGLIALEGQVTEEGYAFAAKYEQPMVKENQRLILGATDEPVPGPFATPHVNAYVNA